MHPTLHLFGWDPPSYAVLLLLAIVAGTAIAHARARADGLASRSFLAPALAAAVAGVAGARLWSVVVERWTLTGELEPELVFANSGLSVVGGLVFGGAAAWLVIRWMRVSLPSWLDAAVPGVAAAISVGRIGCFLAGCCYGKPTLFPIALVFERLDTVARPIGVPLHATQLYESAGAAALAIPLWRLPPTPKWLRFCAFLAGYGILRFAVEQLRADYRGVVAGMPATMLAALVLALVGLGALAALRARALSDRTAGDRRDRGPADGPGTTRTSGSS